MVALIVFLSCVFVALAVGAFAALSDFRGMVIPNVYSLVIFGLFVLCYGVLSVFGGVGALSSLSSHLIGFAVVFVLTLVLFAAKVWGGGDQKLISAFAIWFGFSHIPVFLFYTVIFGGVLGVAALVLRKFKPIKAPVQGSWIEQVQAGGNKVPYGIAIFCGALASFVKIGYFSADTFRIFLG